MNNSFQASPKCLTPGSTKCLSFQHTVSYFNHFILAGKCSSLNMKEPIAPKSQKPLKTQEELQLDNIRKKRLEFFSTNNTSIKAENSVLNNT